MIRNHCFIVVLLLSIILINGAQAQTQKTVPGVVKPASSSTQVVIPTPPVITQKMKLDGIDTFSIMNPTFSKDGKYLAAFFNADKMIRIYEVQTGKVLSELNSDILYSDKFVDGMTFTGADSSKLIIMRAESDLKVIDWKLKKVDSQLALGVTGYKITDFAFTPDQKILAVAKQNGIDVWDFSQNKKIKSLLDGQKINSLDISSDGKILVYAKAGKPSESLGIIDIATLSSNKKPLANPANAQNKLPDYEIQLARFFGNRIIAGYLNLPAGSFKPDGPAGIYLINTQNDAATKSLPISDYRLAFAKYLAPFAGILTNSFNFKNDGSVTSAIDFIDPSKMTILKTYKNSEFAGPMLAFNVSPTYKVMVAAIKTPEGVQLYLYNLDMPKQ